MISNYKKYFISFFIINNFRWASVLFIITQFKIITVYYLVGNKNLLLQLIECLTKIIFNIAYAFYSWYKHLPKVTVYLKRKRVESLNYLMAMYKALLWNW